MGSRQPARQAYTPEYQELKFALHRKLLDRINLEILSSMAGERVRNEIRGALAKLIDEEKTPLSLVEKDRVIDEVLNEVFGLVLRQLSAPGSDRERHPRDDPAAGTR